MGGEGVLTLNSIYLGVVELQPRHPSPFRCARCCCRTVLDEGVVVPGVGRAGVHDHPAQLVLVVGCACAE